MPGGEVEGKIFGGGVGGRLGEGDQPPECHPLSPHS